MKIIIARHGETEENLAGIIQWHLPWRLSSEWISQAKELGVRLKDTQIDAIFSSDLQRAMDTAMYIAQYHKTIKVEPTQKLRERDLGEYEWAIKATLPTAVDDLIAKEGESLEQLYSRAKSFLEEIKVQKYSTVLFVGHRGINRALIAILLWKSYAEMLAMEKQKNTAITMFDVTNDWTILLADNDTSHL